VQDKREYTETLEIVPLDEDTDWADVQDLLFNQLVVHAPDNVQTRDDFRGWNVIINGNIDRAATVHC
jgi:hypothetical protein